MLVFVEKITNRIRYTLDFVFSFENISFEITDNYGKFLADQRLKFNYSTIEKDTIPRIIPSVLMFEDSIRKLNLGKDNFNEEECMTLDGHLDPIASLFFVLSRYEEYLEIEKDTHQRFSAKKSMQYTYNWLDKLICERWARSIIAFIYQANNKEFIFSKKEVTILPTFDIDNAYAFKNKSAFRRLLSFSKDAITLNFNRMQQRRKVSKQLVKDPYDTYDRIKEISKDFPVYLFWLLGNLSKYDKNIPYHNFQQQKLIRKLSGFAKIGIHPSYQSNSKKDQLKIEITRLSRIINSEITCSRQHFLKLSLPQTYLQLIESGIKHDFTMGYADLPGFRSGTVRPHFWFDLKNNEITDLTIHPFTYMDGTLNEYMMLSVDDSNKLIETFYKEIQEFGGEFSFIWHNETINNLGKWEGWNRVLDFSLNLKNDE